MGIQKKGQLSLYMLVGIVLLIVLLLLLNADEEILSDDTPPDTSLVTKTVHTGVSTCLEHTGRMGMLFVAGRGGYFVPPDDYLDFAGEDSLVVSSIPYYQVEHQLHVPTIETVQESVASFVKNRIHECVAGIEVEGHDITYEEATVDVTISTQVGVDIASVKLHLPTVVRSIESQRETRITNYNAHIPTRIGSALQIAQSIVEDNKDELCLSCLVQNTPKDMYLLTFESNQPPHYVVVYQLMYNETFSREEFVDEKHRSIFKFAAKYESDEHEYKKKVRIINTEEYDNLTAQVGKPFSYTVQTNSDSDYLAERGIVFSDNSDFFDVDPVTGEIHFTPTTNTRSHLFTIKVTDATGEWDSALGHMEVTDGSEVTNE